MNSTVNHRFVAALFVMFAWPVFSQTSPMWQTEEIVPVSTQSERVIVPDNPRIFTLDVAAMGAALATAPERFKPGATAQATLVTLPHPTEGFVRFYVQYAPVMHPDLAAQYPEIRTYAGWGVDDPTARIRLDLTPQGFHAMVLSGSDEGDWFIEPLYHGETNFYQVYYKTSSKKAGAFECQLMHDDDIEIIKEAGPDKAGDCKLRRYRLALACTGEYAIFHGGTVTTALAAMNTTINRVNGVYERDLAVTLQIIANNNLLVYLDPATDPYTNNNASTMLNQNQTTVTSVIGSANYDIGHVFGTGGGGVAGLGVICNSSNKARGVTGSGSPVGDPFDIDYVAHEIGHQFGANHTFNNSCGGNINNSTAFEPGSGSTIMAYAGICSPNVQSLSDDYFHAASLAEIATRIATTSCGVVINESNTKPTAFAGLDYTVPVSTPLILSGVGSDVNNPGSLTYCWEQRDNQSATMPPTTSNTVGPAFRSRKPVASPDRFLPPLPNVIANSNSTWDVLPAVSRTMNWRLTVRDNNAPYGCTHEDDMVLTFAGGAGPFTVTAPNTNVSWPAGSVQTVSWNVANTTAAPVNCANVMISLSTDGGNTFPILLLASTPNDGSETVTIPANISPTAQARIRVMSVDNIFYDMSNVNFSITAPVSNYFVTVNPSNMQLCAGSSATTTVSIDYTGAFSGTVNLSAATSNAAITTTFSTLSFTGPGTSTLTVNASNALSSGTYTVTVTGTSGASNRTAVVTVQVISTPDNVSLISPANGATGVSLSPTLTWNAVPGATSYNIQVSTASDFSSSIVNTSTSTPSYAFSSSLNTGTVYFWRVRAVNSCQTGAWASTSFTTGNINCVTVASSDVPKQISASGTPTVVSNLNLSLNGQITDVNVVGLSITHTYVSDLVVKLSGPSGSIITLFNGICSDHDNIALNFDSQSPNTYSSIPCPATNNSTYQPLQSLNVFNGQNSAGTWNLTISDLFDLDGGSLNAWSINVCAVVETLPLTISASSTPVLCFGTPTGSAAVSATGGTGLYSYLWSNGATTASINNLAAGIYTVTVTSGSSSSTASITLTQPTAIVVTTSGTNATTTTGTGSVTASATGGVAPYTYSWSNGATTASINNVPIGTYTVTVTDANNCTRTATRNVLGPNITVTMTRTNVTCAGGSNGTATANASGGNGTYTYSWSNGASTQTITGLAAGTYTVTVTSGTQTKTRSTTITQPSTVFTATPTVTPTSCGLNNGKVTVAVTNGTAASYVWSTGATTSSITKLAAGTYTVTVTSTQGCVTTASAVIVPSVGVTLNLSITQPAGANNGSIVANVTGSAPFTFAWNTGSTASSLTNLGGGAYTVTVTGSNGCSATARTALYCAVKGTTASEWIQRVQLGSLDNISGNNQGWADFTNLPPPVLIRGVSTAITLTPGYAGSALAENWRVFIDANNDGDFNDTGESLLSTSATGVLTAGITVPITATLGLVRMRIVMRRSTTPGSCSNFNNGEAEDYLIQVANPFGGEQTEAILIEETNPTLATSKMALVPNPAADQAGIHFTPPDEGTYTMRITTLSGLLVASQQTYVTVENAHIRIDLSGLPDGVYFVHVTGSGFSGTGRLVIRK